MFTDTMIELERAAKALDLSDVPTAAVCLRKAMEGHVEMEPPAPTPEPQQTGPMAELAKAINAFEIKEFSLAALCTEKAAASLGGYLPPEVAEALSLAARGARTQDFPSMASNLRTIVRHYTPELTTPPPAEAPNAAGATPLV